MWVVIQIAKSLESANHTQEILSREGFLVKLRQIYKNVPQEQNYYEVRVLKSEAREARDILSGKMDIKLLED